MDFFDGWSTFKKTDEGKTIFYPNGFWGKGFVLPNLKRKKEIQRVSKRLYITSIALYASLIIGAWVCVRLVPFGWLWYTGAIFITLALGIGLWFQRSINNLAIDLPESGIKLSIRDSYLISVRSLSFMYLLVPEVMSVWAVYTGFRITNMGLDFGFTKAIGISAIIFGILLCTMTTHMIFMKAKIHFAK